MKKRYFIGGTLAVALCVIVLCAFAANESADVPEAAATGQQTATTVSRSGGKVLVAYFSVPETDGVDASSGASRLVSDGKLQGNTEYVATVIGEATGGDLFEIKTVHTYPGTHKELIDAAKKRIGRRCPSGISYPHQESGRVRCGVRRVPQLVVQYAPTALHIL